MKEDRIALYRFLSIGFTYPEDNFSEIVKRSIDMITLPYTRLNKENYKITGIKNLKRGLKELSKMSFEEWQALYTSLFIANFPKTPLHPYESFYKEGIVGGDVSYQLEQIYKSCGLEIFDERELPDYLIFELEFASFLIEHQTDCKPIYNEFFFNHFFDWIPIFFEDVYNYEDTHLFYKSLSEIGLTFLKKEEKLLKELIDEG